MTINSRVNAPVRREEASIDSFDDFTALRARFAATPQTPKIVPPDAPAPVVSFPGQDARVLLQGEESGGSFVVFDLTIMPGFGAPPHDQAEEDEFWYVIDGELDIQIGDQFAKIGTGAFAYAPRGCTHAFTNNTDRPVKMLSMNSPAGHERFFESVSRLNEMATDDARHKLMVDHGVNFHDKVVNV